MSIYINVEDPKVGISVDSTLNVGPRGRDGATGPSGPQGPKGDDGRGFTILKTFPTIEEFEAEITTGEPGDAYKIGEGSTYYILLYVDGTWENIGSLTGKDGKPGKDGEPGKDGDPGAPGEAATITIGNVTTVLYNEQAEVTNSGDENNAIFNFSLPCGKGLIILGSPVSDVSLLPIEDNEIGDARFVGEEQPYSVYFWDGTNWYNGGQLQGKPGKDGAAGPNLVDENTSTSFEGLLKAEGGFVKTAMAGIDFQLPLITTAALVGQTIAITEIDENGIPISWAPTDFPTGGETDLSNYFTKEEITTNFYTKESIDSTLNNYVQTSVLEDYVKTEVLSNYVTTQTLNNYYTQNQVQTYIAAQLSNYYDKSTIDQKLAEISSGGTIDLSNYYTKLEVDDLFKNYYNQSDISGLLEYYLLKDDFNTTLTNYSTTSEVNNLITAALSTYATTTYVDEAIAEIPVPDVSAQITTHNEDSTAHSVIFSNYYKKTEIDSKLTSVYKYCGSVATYNNLPTSDLTTGDVYNIEQADSTHNINAGDNVAWDGTKWEKLAGTIDLTAYWTSEQIEAQGYLTSYTETDPTVPSWAKASTKPTYSSNEITDSTIIINSTVAQALSSLKTNKLDNTAIADWAKASTKPTYSVEDITGAASTTYVDEAISGITIPEIPTSLKNPYAIKFQNGSSVISYDGSKTVTITASTLGALTSHQDISGKLNIAGGTMTGPLTLAGAPTELLHAATKAYVDSKGVQKFSKIFSTSDWIASSETGELTITIEASEHGCGTNFVVDLYATEDDGNLTKSSGIFTTYDWKVSINSSSGQIIITTTTAFDGKIIVI